MNTQTIESLQEKWAALLQEQPKTRIRDAAKILDTSEAQLLATQSGDTVTHLSVEIKSFFKHDIPTLGKVKALTRNDDVVHERMGAYVNPSFSEKSPVGMFVGEDIDLRIFLFDWKYTFAVTESPEDKPRRSIQFFDSRGNAIHKIYLLMSSDVQAYEAIVQKYKSSIQSITLEVSTEPIKKEVRNESPDKSTFQTEWLNLEDTHHFHSLLMKHKLTRLQALELAPQDDHYQYAVRVDNTMIRRTIVEASTTQTPIMVFVGNKGIIQIHTGPVKKTMDYGEWFNIMDPDFNLHLRESAVAQCWVVKKPTSDGIVTSVEIFDQHETLICTLFGKRKPGIPEDENWTKIIQELQDELLIK